jgi:two-component system chemotaxis sensor kinase CheA
MAQEELLDLFAQDAADTIRDLEQALILLEDRPDDGDLINRIFRAAHTIKGNAGIVGLGTLAGFTHTMETVLDAVRGGSIPVGEQLISALLASVDVVRGMIERLPADPPPEEVRGLADAENMLEACARSQPAPVASEPPSDNQAPAPPLALGTRRFELELRFGEDLLAAGHDPMLLLEELGQLGTL